jgi:hypothetical protein
MIFARANLVISISLLSLRDFISSREGVAISARSFGCLSDLIPTGERSGLPAHIATTESDSLCAQMKN